MVRGDPDNKMFDDVTSQGTNMNKPRLFKQFSEVSEDVIPEAQKEKETDNKEQTKEENTEKVMNDLSDEEEDKN